MFRTRGKKTLLIILLPISILAGLIFLPVIYSLSDQLSKTDRVNANVLLVEGWIPHYALEQAYKEFQDEGYKYIVTTGLKLPDYYLVGMNGYLIFYPKRIISSGINLPEHLIEIEAYSELGGENSSQFNVYVNDSLTANFKASKMKRKYPIRWKGELKNIDSIMVQFLNDKRDNYVDRNLYVKEVIIDGNFKIPYQNNSEYDISELDGKRRIINNFNSYAQLARRRLLTLGIDSSQVIAIPGKRTRINRTLTSALAFRDWLAISDTGIKGINIVTMGTHARRTWMTYKKILNKKYDIGIISLPDYRDSHSRRHKITKTLRETFGLIYYWFILLPYQFNYL
jgi:hypothetical protein